MCANATSCFAAHVGGEAWKVVLVPKTLCAASSGGGVSLGMVLSAGLGGGLLVLLGVRACVYCGTRKTTKVVDKSAFDVRVGMEQLGPGAARRRSLTYIVQVGD